MTASWGLTFFSVNSLSPQLPCLLPSICLPLEDLTLLLVCCLSGVGGLQAGEKVPWRKWRAIFHVSVDGPQSAVVQTLFCHYRAGQGKQKRQNSDCMECSVQKTEVQSKYDWWHIVCRACGRKKLPWESVEKYRYLKSTWSTCWQPLRRSANSSSNFLSSTWTSSSLLNHIEEQKNMEHSRRNLEQTKTGTVILVTLV